MLRISTDDLSVTQHLFGGGPDILAAVRLRMIKKRKETKAEQNLRIKAQMVRGRQAMGWNQAETAGYLGISKSNYEKYEGPPDKKGSPRRPPLDVLIEFCRLTNVDLDFFLTAEHWERRKQRIG